MLKLLAQGKTTDCTRGANLREILLQNGIDLYNGDAKVINWQAMGSCGTCAVHLEDEVSQENWQSPRSEIVLLPMI